MSEARLSEHWLWFNSNSKRWQFHDRELHCGDGFQISIGGQWVETRIEHSSSIDHSYGWYLVTHPKMDLCDTELLVRRSQ
jgi:hypothetical protein